MSVDCTAFDAFNAPPSSGSSGNGSSTNGNPIWLAVAVLFVAYATLVQLWYLRVRPLSMRLQKRSRILLLLSSLGGGAGIAIVCFGEYLGRENIECSLYFAIVFMSVPVCGGPMAIRFLLFYLEAKNAKNEMKMGIGESGPRRDASPTALNKTTKLTAVFQARYSFSSTNPIVIAMYAGFLLPYAVATIIIVLLVPMFYGGCYGCSFDLTEGVSLLLSGAFMIAFVIVGAFSIRKFQDPLGLRAEPLIAALSGGFFIGIGWLLIAIDPVVFDAKGSVVWQSLFIAGIFSVFSIQSVLQILIARHIMKTARSVDDLTLKDILDNPETHGMFKKYMISEWAVDSVMFLENYYEWKEQHAAMPDGYLRAEAEKIFAKYFGPRAPVPLNISMTNARAVQEEFAIPGGALNKACFDKVHAELVNLISSDSVPRFMAKHGDDVRRLLLTMGTERGAFIGAPTSQPISKSKSRATETNKVSATVRSELPEA